MAGTELTTYEGMERLAHALVKSKLFGIQSVDQAIALMAVAQATGKSAASIAIDYDIIQGRPSKKSAAMLRDFIASGGSVKWHELTEKVADATFSHPAGGTVRIKWDMDTAKQAGLAGKSGPWQQYPRAMLRSRCVSEGVRTVCPLATGGLYTPEEVTDMAPPPTPEEIDVTPIKPVLTTDDVQAHVAAMRKAADLGELREAFKTAYSDAKQAGDVGALEMFEATKDDVKASMEAVEEDA